MVREMCEALEAEGFEVYEDEWWHFLFDYKDKAKSIQY